MMRKVLLIVIVIAAAFMFICGCDGAASEVSVGDADDGGEVVLGVGQLLVVELPGNPTTGFNWSIAKTPAFLTALGEPEFEADSDLAGASGTVTLRFSADEVGAGRLELRYERSWEDVEPEDTYAIDVVCR